MKGAYTRDVLTGVFSLAGLAGLAVMLWVIGDLKELMQKSYAFDLKLAAAAGISPSSPVNFNGVRVGKVKNARLDPDALGGVIVTLDVRAGTLIPDDFTVYIDRSFVGQTTVQLEAPARPAGASLEGVEFVKPLHAYSRTPTSIYDLIMGPLKEPLQKFNKVADNLDRLAATYDDVGKEIKDALAPRSPADVDAGKAEPNVRSAIARIEAAAGNLNKWLGDDALRTDAKGLFTKADALIDKAGATADAWTASAKNIDAQATRVADKIDSTTTEAAGALRRVSEASEQVTSVAAGINRGEGTLGQLARNPDLYNSVRDAADRLERALRELQLLIEKYREEGLPLKF